MHQVPFLEALAGLSTAEVVVVYAERLAAERLTLGWQPARSSSVREVFTGGAERERLLADDAPTTVHVLSGFRCHPAIRAALRTVSSGTARVGVMSEAHDGAGASGLVRRWRSTFDALSYGRRVSFILAMGQLGVTWFRDAGFSGDRVHAFAYVTAASAVPPSLPEGAFRVIYVGQLIHRKGVDLLLDSISEMPESAAQMTIVGTGVAEASLRAKARILGIDSRITWHGVVPNEKVPGLLAAHDLLVLPSRFDGWGAVVNEALTVGTPVLCSTTCGAADLIHNGNNGTTFPGSDGVGLTSALSRVIAGGRASLDRRCDIAREAKAFSPATVAAYFLEVVRSTADGSRPPPPPWRREPGAAHG